MVIGASLKSASYIWQKTCRKRRAALIDLRINIVSAYEHGKSSGGIAPLERCSDRCLIKPAGFR
jgi:hypothetical protein